MDDVQTPSKSHKNAISINLHSENLVFEQSFKKARHSKDSELNVRMCGSSSISCYSSSFTKSPLGSRKIVRSKSQKTNPGNPMNTGPSMLIDKHSSTDMSCKMKGEYDKSKNNKLNLNTLGSSSPDLNLYLSSSELSNISDDEIEIIGEYIVNSGKDVSHKTKQVSDVEFKKPANHYTTVAANTNSQLSRNSNTQTEHNINILKERSLEEERKPSMHSSETICFCTNFEEKIKNLITKTTSLQDQLNGTKVPGTKMPGTKVPGTKMPPTTKTTSLQDQLNGMCSSDYDNTQKNSHINSVKDSMTLQEALKSLSFALKVTLRQGKVQKKLSQNTKCNAVNHTLKSPLNSNEGRTNTEEKQESSRAFFKNGDNISSFSQSLTKVGDEFTTESTSKQGKEPDQIIKPSKKVLIKGPDGERKYCLCENGTLPVTKDMIGCDFCEMWYHPSCIGLKTDDIDEIIKTRWMCPLCDQLCNGMFVKQPDLKSTPNKRKLKLQKMESNHLSDLDENRNSSTFKEKSLKRKKMDPKLEMLEIEQSFNLSTGRNSSLKLNVKKVNKDELKDFNQTDDNDYDSNEITTINNQYIKDRVRTKHINMSKPDKWIVRKKYQSRPDNYRIYETNSSLGLMDGGISRKSDSRKNHICKEKWYKKKVKNRNSKQNFKGEFIYKQTLLINGTKAS